MKKLGVIVLAVLLLVACTPQDNTPQPNPTPTPNTGNNGGNETVTGKLYQGLGRSSNFRVGPGADESGVPVYSFNFVYASGVFDEEGRIVNMYVDVLEVSTPNYDGETMPHFSGWPGTEGYNVAEDGTGTVTGKSENTEESLTEEVANWETKRDRGDEYGMNPNNDWHKQMDFFQEYFKGKTIAEMEEWFEKYASDRNGRPLNPATTNEEDKTKLDTLSDEEKTQLEDVVSGATMSLNDAHGDLIAAMKNAYENRVEITANTSAE